jgi:SAM-dependent methyltransferase
MLQHRLIGQPRACPYCGPSSPLSLLRRKKLIMDILQCGNCRLIFRWPIDDPEELDVHYESGFAEAAPQVRTPDPNDLQTLIENDFAPIFGPDLKHKIAVLKAIRGNGRVLDYGCSWGYTCALMRKNGYETVGFEISKWRAEYARTNLGLTVIDSVAGLGTMPNGCFDIIYSNHVLEHLQGIRDALDTFARLLSSDGIALHVIPNFGGGAWQSGEWINWIGQDHPIAPTIEFFKMALPAAGFGRLKFASTPFDESALSTITDPDRESSMLEGHELLIVSQK